MFKVLRNVIGTRRGSYKIIRPGKYGVSNITRPGILWSNLDLIRNGY